MVGIALLVFAIYFLREFVHHSTSWWRREMAASNHPAESSKSGSASDDPVLKASKPKVYGVLSAVAEETNADEAEPSLPSGPPSAVDHVSVLADATPNHFLHRRVTVKTYQGFAFVVPPHAVHPRLRGTLRCVVKPGNPGGGSPVELWLMNEAEFASFARKEAATPTFAADASAQGKIDWNLSATFGDEQKYYLVFQNPSEGRGLRIVDADFTVSFE
jgi:hypothetical protein